MSDFYSNKDKLRVSEAKFILEQAEKTLKETGDQSQVIVARTTTLLVLVSGLIIAVIAYLVKEYFNLDTLFVDSLITSLFYLFILCIVMIMNITGKDYYPLGSAPKVLLLDDFFTTEDVDRHAWFIIAEIERCQKKIDYNNEINEKRWTRFNRHLWLTILIPVVFISTYLIFRLF